MAFERNGYQFDGAYTSPDSLEEKLGVYVIWCKLGESWTCLDIGESHNVKDRVKNHDRADQWSKNCRGQIYFAAHYTPHLQQSGRMEIEQRLRTLEKPVCGER